VALTAVLVVAGVLVGIVVGLVIGRVVRQRSLARRPRPVATPVVSAPPLAPGPPGAASPSAAGPTGPDPVAPAPETASDTSTSTPDTAMPDTATPPSATPASATPASATSDPDTATTVPDTATSAPAIIQPPATSAPEAVPAGSPPGQAGAVVTALWDLVRLDLAVARRRLAEVSTAVDDSGSPGLAEALADEVTRLREEMGVPGFLRHRPAGDVAADRALLVLRVVEATLDRVARRSQAFDLDVESGPDRMTATIVCDDYSGDHVADADLLAVADAVAPVGGSLHVDDAADGRMRVRVHIPA
jgi:hypothetical protein